MFSHVYYGVNDFKRAMSFYEPLMKALGLQLRFNEPSVPWAGWQPQEGGRPLFIVGRPFDGLPHSSGNGQMVAFAASSRAVVEAAYAVALQSGGISEGKPGLRSHYHSNYFGAYIRDPEGNKICVACHSPE
ncbi:lactoylglutathione lyase-like lyase [Burkholderiales bacterium JOSHI_001]|nr:lactoylglutathione lyase-like lyase [Burkholderiales bacterium JOSHI_001]